MHKVYELSNGQTLDTWVGAEIAVVTVFKADGHHMYRIARAEAARMLRQNPPTRRWTR